LPLALAALEAHLRSVEREVIDLLEANTRTDQVLH
jgi:hypothetical protein